MDINIYLNKHCIVQFRAETLLLVIAKVQQSVLDFPLVSIIENVKMISMAIVEDVYDTAQINHFSPKTQCLIC